MANNPPYGVNGAQTTNVSGGSMQDYQAMASENLNYMWSGLSSMGSTVAQKASETNQAYIAPSLTSASAKI